MRADISRRGVLAGGAVTAGVLAAGGCGLGRTTYAGTLGGADMARGHGLRDGTFPKPKGAVEQVPLVIAGGGVAGLAAGWRLAEAGFEDFVLLELEDSVGGNARSGASAVTAFPLGAHYLPVPNREARGLRQMLAGFGMITGEVDGVPVYDPYQLCADLEERLFWQGRWQEGLYPSSGLSARDVAERDGFLAAMAAFSRAVGGDGRPAFASPMAYASADPAFTALDAMSFAAWLDARGWRGRVLREHVRYCLRDDYGAEPEAVSAWAGVQYFAGRRGWAAGGDGDRELTWPEGNARLTGLMAGRIGGKIRTGQSVFAAGVDGDGAALAVFDHRAGVSRALQAEGAIMAMPQFVARHVVAGLPSAGFAYSPWVVANVHVSRLPRGKGVPLAWDNVSAGSNALGYVVATHQTNSAGDGPSVLTWYLPLSERPPAEERKAMLARPLAEWQAMVAEDLLVLHPELAGAIERIDVWRWGHGMVRPVPGFLGDRARVAAAAAAGPIWFAHSDLSGLSLFEEAHYRGMAAAEAAMRHLGHAFESYL